MPMIGRALVACLAVGTAFAAQPSPYLDQPLPQLVPERFAPGLVSTDAIELNTVFSPDLQEAFFARWVNGVAGMFHAQRLEGVWTPPRAPRPRHQYGVHGFLSDGHPGREVLLRLTAPGRDLGRGDGGRRVLDRREGARGVPEAVIGPTSAWSRRGPTICPLMATRRAAQDEW